MPDQQSIGSYSSVICAPEFLNLKSERTEKRALRKKYLKETKSLALKGKEKTKRSLDLKTHHLHPREGVPQEFYFREYISQNKTSP